MTVVGLRAIAQSIVEECDGQVAELGPAAHHAVLDARTCRAVIAVIDLANTFPPNIGPDAVPRRIKESLDNFALYGMRPGDTLCAVLANDLRLAYSRADAEVVNSMQAIVSYVMARLPSQCWGSRDAVEAWIRKPRS